MPKKFQLEKATVLELDNRLKLPYHGTIVPDSGFSFSFASFDRTHKLFNLGDNSEKSGIVSSEWFIALLDCLKVVNRMTVAELKSSMHDLHPVDWHKANTSMPEDGSQCEYWQFRINKGRGRVIGVLIDGVFYVVWLDPHHNLSNSKGYRQEEWYKPALSEYEKQEILIAKQREENLRLIEELTAAEELLMSVTNTSLKDDE